MKVILFTLASLLVLSLCACARATYPANYRIHDIWVLKSMNGEEIVNPSSQLPVLEINLTRGEVMGNDGCNEYSAPILKSNKKKLSIGTLQRTKLACPTSELPDRYAALLPRVKTYGLKGLNLMLFDATGDCLITFRKVD